VIPPLPWKLIAKLAVPVLVLLVAWWQLVSFGNRREAEGRAAVRAEWDQAIADAKLLAAEKERTDAADTEKQDGTDASKVTALEKQVADLLARPPRVVRVRDQPPSGERVPSSQADAGTGGAACPAAVDGGPDDRPVERAALIEYAAVAEKLRLAVMSCQAQWPK
jgi:hypothetical protein